MRLRRTTFWAVAAVLAGCGDGPGPIDAASSVDARLVAADAGVPSDGAGPLLWVDFAISGCPSGGAEMTADAGVTAPCTGSAPLTLGFAAISAAPIELYLWSFGDSTSSDLAAPQHTYERPGSYDVSLVVGGIGGTASVAKPGVVVVEPAGLGDRCTLAAQCLEPLSCVCAPGDGCPAELTPGLCAIGCADQTCETGVCADLAPGDPAEPEPWQQSLCLLACADDDACSDGLACRELRDGDGTGWVRGCFAAGLLGAIGASCRDGSGALNDTRCASGTCWDQGARGMCSEACSVGGCPDSAACATFTGVELGAHCLARCTDPGDCADDPWLACEAPGGSGDLGFTVDEAAAPLGYCAPRTCSEPEECGDGGTCTDGFCGPA